MKRFRTVIAVCVLAASCGEPSGLDSPLTGPTPVRTGRTPTGSYTLTGSIRDLDGTTLAAVPVVADQQGRLRTTVSGADGGYRFDEVSGFLSLRISRDGYQAVSKSVWVAADQVVDFALERIVVLTPGTTIRGTVRGQPCDPARWDSSALCQRVFFTPPTSGTLDLVLSWSGASELDLLFDPFDWGAPYWSAPFGGHEIRASVDLVGSVQREIRINSYYQPQEFELSASFRSAR